LRWIASVAVMMAKRLKVARVASHVWRGHRPARRTTARAASHIAPPSETAGLSIHEWRGGGGKRVAAHSFDSDAANSRRLSETANVRRGTGRQLVLVGFAIRTVRRKVDGQRGRMPSPTHRPKIDYVCLF
jgi:hypothetical protein